MDLKRERQNIFGFEYLLALTAIAIINARTYENNVLFAMMGMIVISMGILALRAISINKQIQAIEREKRLNLRPQQ